MKYLSIFFYSFLNDTFLKKLTCLFKVIQEFQFFYGNTLKYYPKSYQDPLTDTNKFYESI